MRQEQDLKASVRIGLRYGPAVGAMMFSILTGSLRLPLSRCRGAGDDDGRWKAGMDGVGAWEQIRGTGSLVNVQLRGTWTAKPISEKEYVMDWEGTPAEAKQIIRVRGTTRAWPERSSWKSHQP